MSQSCGCAKKLDRPGSSTQTILLSRGPENGKINQVMGPPHVALKIGTETVHALIDTGADRTLVTADLLDKILPRTGRERIEPSSVQLRGATGHPLKVLGQIPIVLNFRGVKVKHIVQVIDNMRDTLLLGSDLMRDKVSLNKGRQLAIVHRGDRATLPINYEMPRMRVATSQLVEIAPNSVRLAECHVILQAPLHANMRVSEEILVTVSAEGKNSSDDKTYGLGVEDVLTSVDSKGKINCLLANTTPDPIVIEANTYVGNAVPAARTDDPCTPYEEFKSRGKVYYLHEEGTKAAILAGNKDGFNPIPPGYEREEKRPEPPKLDEVKTQGLTDTDRRRLVIILKRYSGVFSRGADDYGCTPLMAFSIETEGQEPVAARYRPIPAAYEVEVKKTVDSMLENGVIEEADSPWNSTLVLVRKPDGKLRICVNLKGVNAVTSNGTSYPINQQEQSFARLCNGKYFFKLDLSQAYYAIPLATDADKDKTAFSAFGKQYRFKVSPFGARYLPSRFNKLMTTILQGLDHYLFYYFDDVIGCFQTVEELLSGLATVLQRLLAANLRVNFAKSEFALSSLDKIKWLGSVIQHNKVYPDSEKIKAILDMPAPTNRNAIQRFLGAINYHRRHLAHLADVAAPLNKLVSKKVEFDFTNKHQAAFEQLKRMLANAPPLALPDTSRKFIITTDASDIGVGGVLSQPSKDDSTKEDVVAYCSRTLTANEQNGSSCEKEILAILYSVTVFHFYIANSHFTLRSDSKSLVFLRHFKNLNSKLFRASLMLDELSFDIQHMSATRNNLMGVADMLSRAYGQTAPDPPRASYKTLRQPVWDNLRAPPDMPADQAISRELFDDKADQYLKDFLSQNPDAHVMQESDRAKAYVIESDPSPDALIALLSGRNETRGADDPHRGLESEILHVQESLRRVGQRQNVLTLDLFKAAQRADQNLAPLIEQLEADPEALKDRYFLQKQLLCSYTTPENGLRRTVVVVPKELQPEVMHYYHGAPQGLHRGRKRMYATLQYYYTWKGMATAVEEYCKSCPICIYETPDTNPQVVLGRATVTEKPNVIVNIDIVGPFMPSTDQMRYILTMQCDFSKYVLAFPLRRKTAESIVKTIVQYWIAPFGAPQYIRSDEGTDCDSSLMQYVCTALGIQKIRTPIYSPQANPIERWHATLGQTMRMWLDETEYKYWPTIVPLIAHGYNTTVHTVHKFQPQELFLGRKAPNKLVPVMPNEHPALNKHQYLLHLHRAQSMFWAIARKNLQRDKDRRFAKDAHKKKRTWTIGQYVLIRNQAKEHKLSPKWIGPFRIIEVRRNALIVVRWTAEPAPMRFHHHDAEFGTVVKRSVHPKDVRPYNLPLPADNEWGHDFATALFKALKQDYDPSNVPDDEPRDDKRRDRPHFYARGPKRDDDDDSSGPSVQGGGAAAPQQQQQPPPPPPPFAPYVNAAAAPNEWPPLPQPGEEIPHAHDDFQFEEAENSYWEEEPGYGTPRQTSPETREEQDEILRQQLLERERERARAEYNAKKAERDRVRAQGAQLRRDLATLQEAALRERDLGTLHEATLSEELESEAEYRRRTPQRDTYTTERAEPALAAASSESDDDDDASPREESIAQRTSRRRRSVLSTLRSKQRRARRESLPAEQRARQLECDEMADDVEEDASLGLEDVLRELGTPITVPDAQFEIETGRSDEFEIETGASDEEDEMGHAYKQGKGMPWSSRFWSTTLEDRTDAEILSEARRRREHLDRSQERIEVAQKRDLQLEDRRALELGLADAVMLRDEPRAMDIRKHMRQHIQPPAYFKDWRDVWELTGEGAELSEDCQEIRAYQRRRATAELVHVGTPPPDSLAAPRDGTPTPSAMRQIQLPQRQYDRVHRLRARRQFLEKVYVEHGGQVKLNDGRKIPPPPPVPSVNSALGNFVRVRLRPGRHPAQTRAQAVRFLDRYYVAVGKDLADYEELFPLAIQRDIRAQLRARENDPKPSETRAAPPSPRTPPSDILPERQTQSLPPPKNADEAEIRARPHSEGDQISVRSSLLERAGDRSERLPSAAAAAGGRAPSVARSAPAERLGSPPLDSPEKAKSLH